MGSVFVFDPDASYRRIDEIREANEMPEGAHLVASITGSSFKIFSIVDYTDLRQDFTGLVEGLSGGGGSGDPETATVIGVLSKVKRSRYGPEMALVRIEVRGDTDPMSLLGAIRDTIGSDEADAVIGLFDILACVVADDDDGIAATVNAIRGIDGVKTAKPLKVIDFVSESDDAPDGHRIPV
jgi:hypothetical protein